jgi:hypothetical protein
MSEFLKNKKIRELIQQDIQAHFILDNHITAAIANSLYNKIVQLNCHLCYSEVLPYESHSKKVPLFWSHYFTLLNI